jgi:gamma-glutamyl-gamma-aminobutyrate hydrolase PuuD
VQWHPENFWRTGEFTGLFDSFVKAAAAHAHGTARRR